MPTDLQDPTRAKLDARASRRWMIGILITVVFGAFGVVMAVLSYMDRDRPAPAGASSPSPSREREPRDKGKGNNGKHDR